MERNKELFYEIADAIEQNPGNHNQASWMNWDSYMADFRNKEVTGLGSLTVNGETIESCGTTQCVAGWAWTLAGRGQELARMLFSGAESNEITGPAACALGITDEEAEVLFVNSAGHTLNYNWPQVLRDLGDGKDMRQAFGHNHIEDRLKIPVRYFDKLNRPNATTATTNP